MIEKQKDVRMVKTIFLILNYENIALLEKKRKFNICQNCWLLYEKHSCNNIGLVVGIPFLEGLAYHLLQL